MIKKKIIFGCDTRGDGDSSYLTRWTLFATKRQHDDQPAFAVYLHRFHRSDSEEFHDHPWGFVSLILWRGYIEETPSTQQWRDVVEWDVYASPRPGEEVSSDGTKIRFRRRKRAWPGMLLIRPATTIHRVELVEDKEAWSLVFRGKYIREWGFFTKGGWQRWREYFKERGC